MENIPESFNKTLSLKDPPEYFSIYLRTLWFDRKGQWSKAHGLVDSLGGIEAARVHAYLHRKEGDQSNASYWYRRAGINKPDLSLEEEWEMLVSRFLEQT